MKTFFQIRKELQVEQIRKPAAVELKVKGEFEFNAVIGKDIKAKVPMLVNIKTTASGKLKSITTTVADRKYYNMIPGRSMSGTSSSKRDLQDFLKRGRELFIELPNNDYNNEKGWAGRYTGKLDADSLKKVNDAIKSLNGDKT
jgi:hypothetical protein